jgi:hypothetical protein
MEHEVGKQRGGGGSFETQYVQGQHQAEFGLPAQHKFGDTIPIDILD